MQGARSEQTIGRSACLIIERHPQTPSEVQVACRKLTGILVIGECGTMLRVRVNFEDEPLTCAEFQAMAGCGKSHNWKVRVLPGP